MSRISVLYHTLLVALERLEDIGDTEATSPSVLIQNKKFIFVLNALVSILDVANFATVTLQKSNQTMSEVKSHINALKSTLQSYRNEDTQVKKLLKVVDEICEKENIVVFDKVTRRRCDLLHFTNKGNATNTDTPLRRIFNEILDILLVGIELRFTDEAMDIIEAGDLAMNKKNFSYNSLTKRLQIEIPECESTFFKHFCDD